MAVISHHTDFLVHTKLDQAVLRKCQLINMPNQLINSGGNVCNDSSCMSTCIRICNCLWHQQVDIIYSKNIADTCRHDMQEGIIRDTGKTTTVLRQFSLTCIVMNASSQVAAATIWLESKGVEASQNKATSVGPAKGLQNVQLKWTRHHCAHPFTDTVAERGSSPCHGTHVGDGREGARSQFCRSYGGSSKPHTFLNSAQYSRAPATGQIHHFCGNKHKVTASPL